MAEDRLHLIETTIVPDVWVDGIGKVEKIAADTYRLMLYRTRYPLEGGPAEHEVVLSVLASGASATVALSLVHNFLKSSDCMGLFEVAAVMMN